jgi:penicillin-binding protein 1A
VVTGGTGTSAQFSGMTIAGKTGTTSNNYDRYFVGYTPYYVAAVWTGYADKNEKISYEGNPAITMWKKVMQQVHENLPNKSFEKPSTGLTTVSICADSGLKPSEACSADPRGSRVISVEFISGTEPTGTCEVHQMVNYCTEGQCLATENCPESAIVQRAYLNHERVDYGSGVVAEDNAYLISTLEAAVGLRATENEDGTTTTASGCPVHGEGYVEPEDPNGEIEDPEGNATQPGEGGDFNIINGVGGETGSGVGGGNVPSTGAGTGTGSDTIANVPSSEPEESGNDQPVTDTGSSDSTGGNSGGTTGGASGNWWDDLWNT